MQTIRNQGIRSCYQETVELRSKSIIGQQQQKDTFIMLKAAIGNKYITSTKAPNVS